MIIVKKDFPSVLKDNELAYFSLLEGVINSVDEASTMEIRKNPDNYKFRIAISTAEYLNSLVDILNDMHSLFGIKLNYSKSIKSSCSITFYLELN